MISKKIRGRQQNRTGSGQTYSAVLVPLSSGGSELISCIEGEATEKRYIQEEWLCRFRKSPLLDKHMVSAAELGDSAERRWY
jgi:hypothetical protein